MKHILRVLCSVALVAACASAADAQCEFNALARARGMKASMVRAFVGCPSTLGGPGHVNTETGGGTPACDPIAALSIRYGHDREVTQYLFDPQTGTCDVQTKARIEKDCSLLKDSDGEPLGLPARACSVIYIKARCQGITRGDGTPIDVVDAGWSLAIHMSLSINDSSNGDMTVIDLPITQTFDNPNNGKIKLDGSTAQALAWMLYDISGAALPTCTSAQLLSVTIKDPYGLPFAVLGGSTRAAAE